MEVIKTCSDLLNDWGAFCGQALISEASWSDCDIEKYTCGECPYAFCE